LTAPPIRRALLVTGLLILVFGALLDLLQHDSLLRRAWAEMRPDRMTPARQSIEEFQRTRGQSIRR
jgi:hypothetical protein